VLEAVRGFFGRDERRQVRRGTHRATVR
jgi:hypothetical protein